MTAAQTSTTIQKGADFTFAFQAREFGPTSPLSNLNLWTWTPILLTATGSVLATPAVGHPSPECVEFTLTAAQTTLMTAQTGVQLTINAIRPDGYKMRFIRARITISA
jgi:hypothetical protein